MNACARVEGFDPKAVRAPINRWIVGEASAAVTETTAAIEAYRFNDAANAAYRFVWNVFCDWYLELAKPLLMGDDEAVKAETRATAAWTLDVIFKLLHPFMPFLTEELWAIKGAEGPKRESLLVLSDWPALDGLGDSDDDDDQDLPSRPLPVLVSAADFSSQQDGSLIEFVKRALQKRWSDAPQDTTAALVTAFHDGRVALFIDALNDDEKAQLSNT